MQLAGRVTKGMGLAGKNLQSVLSLIEQRSGLSPLIPNTLNVKLPAAYHFVPDFAVTRAESSLAVHAWRITAKAQSGIRADISRRRSWEP